MANKSHTTRTNVIAKRGSLPQPQRKIVDNKAVDRFLRKAEDVGLILHTAQKPRKNKRKA